jgi:hypothetical protein
VELCDHNVTDDYIIEYEMKNFISEAFQQDREWLNSLHFIQIFLSVCHSYVADLVGISKAVWNLILYKCVHNVQVDSTDNRCVPNLKTKSFSPDLYDSLLTLIEPADSGILTIISSWLTIRWFFFGGGGGDDVLFQ